MRLPSIEETSFDPFVASLRQNDAEKYLSPKWGTNQKFINKRRFDFCIALLEKYLAGNKNKDTMVGDFACGTANVGISLAEKGYKVDLIENEEKFYDYIKLKTDSNNINFIQSDVSQYCAKEKYTAIFLGEAIEHMEKPDETLKLLCQNLKPGGILCLSTPNGDFVNCYEPNWSEVKDNTERNAKLANTFGNHVCEFKPLELKELVQMAGFCLLEHHLIQSQQICDSSIMRRIIPNKILWSIDKALSKKKDKSGKLWGMNQVIVAQRARS
ncbi:MAG: class I SAM-dependent methyltransferase [Bacteriovoracia bacterium]